MVPTVFGLVMYKFVAEEVTNAFECPASPADHPNMPRVSDERATASSTNGFSVLLLHGELNCCEIHFFVRISGLSWTQLEKVDGEHT